MLPQEIIRKKREGEALSDAEIAFMVDGLTNGSVGEGQVAAFAMAVFHKGMSRGECVALTLAMRDSGKILDWSGLDGPVLDKHSTGGVGDKVSLVLGPLLASRGVPIAMLAGRGLGHTGGTVDKLEAIPGLDLTLDRRRCVDLLGRCRLAIGMATAEIAPADRRLYALRDATATVDSLPLVVASILSKKLATGAAAIVFDVKTGDGAFFPEPERARELARRLVDTCRDLGTPASALITDVSQPIGAWVGHAAEVEEALACLAGEGPADLAALAVELAAEVAALAGFDLSAAELEQTLAGGRGREAFLRWAELQGAGPAWLRAPSFPRAPIERPLVAPRAGRLARVKTRQLGLLLAEAGGGRHLPGDAIDHGVSLRVRARLGERVEPGEELARLYLRRDDPHLTARAAACFAVADEARAPELILERVE